jgi:hypothetical protein
MAAMVVRLNSILVTAIRPKVRITSWNSATTAPAYTSTRSTARR